MRTRKEFNPFPSADDFYLPIDVFVASVNAFKFLLRVRIIGKRYIRVHMHVILPTWC